MKPELTRLTGLILFAGLLAGCSWEVELHGAEGKINLGLKDMEQTRDAINSAPEIVSLGIFGYSTGGDNFDENNNTHIPNLFFDRHAERTPGNDWVYTPLAYWPIDAAVKNTFFACSPHSSLFPPEANVALSSATAYGFPTITYTVPAAVSNHVDLLYANPMPNINRKTNSGKVLFEMNHALSWIKIYVAPDVKTSSVIEEYTITSLSLSASALTTRACLCLGTGAWSTVSTGPAQYLFNVTGTAIESGNVEDPTATGECLMLIPQLVSGTMVNVTFIYSYNGVTDPDEYSFAVPFPNIELIAGHIGIYVLRLNTAGVEILFHTNNTIDEWDEDSTYKEILDVY